MPKKTNEDDKSYEQDEKLSGVSLLKKETDEKFYKTDKNIDTANNRLADAIKKIEKMDYVLLGVVVILIIMVATLVIDSFHINSAIYKEYSQKTQSIESTQKINQELLNQNIKNQELIIQLKEKLNNEKAS